MSKAKEIFDFVQDTNVDAAAEKFDISRETVRRYCRRFKEHSGKSEKAFSENILKQLKEKYTENELKALLKGGIGENKIHTKRFNFSGDSLTIGLLGDTHIGSKYTNDNLLLGAFEVFSKNNVDFICHTGDVFEGVSGRAGHYDECTHFGFEAQLDHGIELFSQWKDTPIYMIDGNHDRWFKMQNSANIVKHLAKAINSINYIGTDEGDIKIKNVTIKLWHGLDTGSYAVSYRIQKLVESLTGGEKPNALFTGHTHKATYLYDRHIHCVSSGSIQCQSKWMRGKRIASHTGFWVIKLAINKSGIAWFEPKFFPAYI